MGATSTYRGTELIDEDKPKPKNKGGRPSKFKFTDEEFARIEALAGYGLTIEEICAAMGFSSDTLRRSKRKSAEVSRSIDRGRAKARAVSGKSLFGRVKEGDIPAIRWFESTRFGLSDKTQVETSGETTVIISTGVPEKIRGKDD